METNLGNKLIINMFKALANPTRLQILRLLKEKPLCVNHIIEDLGTEQSNTSQQLNVLKSAGLVESHKDGLNVIYSIKYLEIFGMIDTAENILINRIEETKSSLGKVL